MRSVTARFTAIAVIALGLSAVPVASQVANQSQAFDVAEGGTLVLKLGRADVRVRPGSGTRVQIDGFGLDRRDERFNARQAGNSVTVDFQGRDGHFEILVPRRYNLEVETHRGDIDVLGDLDGWVSVNSHSGDLVLRGVSGDLTAHSGGGDITGGAIGGNATIQTGGGDIGFASIGGTLKVQTGGGDVEVGDVGGDLEVSTGAGDVEMGTIGGQVLLNTGGGDVVLGAASEAVKAITAGGDVDLAGASGRIEVTTAGGDLTLRDLRGSIKATTAGGDVTVELDPEGGEDSSLTTAGGDIRLYLDPSARVTVVCEIGFNRNSRRRNHDIHSDFSGMRIDSSDPGRIRGTLNLNGGGPEIRITTIEGDIYIQEKGR